MISVSIRIQHSHCTRSTSASAHPHSIGGRNLHFAESTSDLFKCIGKRFYSKFVIIIIIIIIMFVYWRLSWSYATKHRNVVGNIKIIIVW